MPSSLPDSPQVLALLEAAGVWMWDFDLAEETTTFQPGFWEQYGYDTAAVEETFEFVRLVEREDLAWVVSAWRAHVEDGTPLYECEWRLRLPGGGHRWIHARGKAFERDGNGKATRVIGMYRDVTEERQAEEDRRTYVAELDAVFNSSPMGKALIWSDYTIIRINDLGRELLQVFYDEAPGEGLDIRNLNRAWPETPILDDIEKALRGGQPADRMVRLPDTPTCLEFTYGPVIGRGGGIAGVVVTVRDVTDRIRGERMRAQALRLESMGMMAGGIAHDFNNLLGAIIGNIDVARLSPGDAEAAEGLDEAREAATRASELVKQLLAFAGNTEPAEVLLGLSELAHEIVRYSRRIPGVRSAPAEELAAGLPPVKGDPTQLRQAVLNLVVNALDATRESGAHVTVRTRTADEVDHAYAVIEGSAGGPYVVVEVEDDGPGMDDSTQRRIFDPFFTTKPTGHGLGLSSVLGAVRRHGGTLTVRSQPGEGATFAVYLPVAG